MKQQGKKWLKKKLEKMRLLECYSVESTNESIAKEIGIAPSKIVKLNYNENFFIPRKKLAELMNEVTEECDLRIYPQEEKNKLGKKLSDYLKTSEDNIVIGNASDELIDRIVRLFLEKGEQAISFKPTFPILRYCTSHQKAEYIEVPLRKDFTLDTEQILNAVTPKTRLLYLCSPNNPTANQFKLDEVKALIEEFPGIVIVDEAYAEYADYSVVSLIDKFENLIVLRTFSKAFGLAGLRLGYAATNVELAKALSEKTPLPFPVSAFTLRVGIKLLENYDTVEKAVKRQRAERDALIKKLDGIKNVEAFDSKTNFVLFHTEKPHTEVYQSLLSQGIIIKKIGKLLHFDNCLRTTVGLPSMNAKLLKALETICVD